MLFAYQAADAVTTPTRELVGKSERAIAQRKS